MTDIRKLTDRLSVAPFVPPAALKEGAGVFGTIINNRPDGEEPGQPTSAEIETAAREFGMRYVHIPVVASQIGEEDVRAFCDAVDNGPGPVLAFCRTGTRSTMMWALAQAGKMSAEEIVERARDAGYELSGLRPRLEQQAAAR
jgi:sulfide:quinone oxidoreductase